MCELTINSIVSVCKANLRSTENVPLVKAPKIKKDQRNINKTMIIGKKLKCLNNLQAQSTGI